MPSEGKRLKLEYFGVPHQCYHWWTSCSKETQETEFYSQFYLLLSPLWIQLLSNIYSSLLFLTFTFYFTVLRNGKQITLAKFHFDKTFVLAPATRSINNAEAFHTYAAGPDLILANSTNCQSNTVLSKTHITTGLVPYISSILLQKRAEML